MSNQNFLRGGHRIELKKEERYFTTIIEDNETQERVRSIQGVQSINKIHGKYYKVQVDPNQRDSAMDMIRSQQFRGIAHHAYHPNQDQTTRYYLTEQIIIQFKEEVELARKNEILEAHKLKFKKKFKTTDTYLVQVTGSTNMNPVKCSNLMNEYEEVTYAEPNLINRFQTQLAPADVLYEEQWHLSAQEDIQLVEGADVNALEAWEVTKGNRDVVVAIIDDGFDINHPDLSGEGKIVQPKDFYDGDDNPEPEASVGDYHGTPCAGVAVGEENQEGIVGIAPECAWMPIRFNLAAEDQELWEIFDFASRHADVISCSWGPVPVFAPLSQLLYDKFSEISQSGGRRGKGALILFAAGNYNAPINAPDNSAFDWFIPAYGLQRTTGPILNGNADHPDVVAVAASTSLNKKAAYSNWGKEISVAAPSSNFHPIDSQAFLPGRSIFTTDNESTGQGFTPNSRYTDQFGGTSSACPLAAGVAALIIAANPELTASQVKQIMEETADKIVDEDPDVVLGNELGTYDESGHSEWFGYGKLNAGAAVRLALETEGSLLSSPAPVATIQSFEGELSILGAEKVFSFDLTQDVRILLEGPDSEDSEDFDLYLKKGSKPTITNYDRRSTDLGSNEVLELINQEPGTYFVMVKSYRGRGSFSLKIVPLASNA
ncbi:MAG: S8 family serine peptidase [Bacteroidota bacterium]